MKTKLIFPLAFVLSGMLKAQSSFPGNPCAVGSSNPLTSNFEIPTATFDYNFSDDNPFSDRVNIGYPCFTAGRGKLNVYTRFPNYSVSGLPESNAFHARTEYSGALSRGILAEADGGAPGSNTGAIGIEATAEGAGFAVGVVGKARSTGSIGNSYGGQFLSNTAGNFRNVGSLSMAMGGTFSNVGVIGVANTLGIWPNSYFPAYAYSSIGIYGSCDVWTPVAPPAAQSYWAGWFDGNVMINGSGYYLGGFTPISSDRRFKHDIQPIENASSVIKKLKPANFFYNKDNEYGINFSDRKQYGFISQEVEEVLPDLVEDVHKPAMQDDKGRVIKKEIDFKALNYMGFIALLTKNAQEQQSTIESLQKQLEEQKQEIAALKSDATGIGANGTIETSFQMSQNEPNPFTHETVVRYTLPQTVSNAFMAVYDLTGKQITTLPIAQKGSSSLTLTSEKLAAGIYIYSIVADGKVIDSKRMIVSEK